MRLKNITFLKLRWMVASSKLIERVCADLRIKETKVNDESIMLVRRSLAKKAFKFKALYEKPDEAGKDESLEAELKLLQSFYVLEERDLGDVFHFACKGCPKGMRKGKCKHALALGIATDKVQVRKLKENSALALDVAAAAGGPRLTLCLTYALPFCSCNRYPRTRTSRASESRRSLGGPKNQSGHGSSSPTRTVSQRRRTIGAASFAAARRRAGEMTSSSATIPTVI